MKRFVRHPVIASRRLEDHKIGAVISANVDQFSNAASVILEAVMIASRRNKHVQLILADVDALLQVYFFFIQFYGLYVWLNGRAPDGRIIVAPLGTGMFALYLGVTAIVWLIVANLMAAYTDAAAPYWDAAVAALSITAQFLLSRRYLQSWYLWIAVDVLAIGLFYTRGLEPTAALYVVFLGLAITGFFQWRRAAMQPLTT